MVKEIYSLTEQFPVSERYGLSSQMQRCAVSIPSNIAEGSARQSKKEYIQFLYIALGSLAELETQLIISHEIGHAVPSQGLYQNIEILRKKLLSFIKFVKEHYA